ncbi:quinoprotein dehydrogenase-associated SoxYZ-like carrier [Roseibium sp.]|uniref:quinoprotein dehydrogenase-associated SoxYZ-like carrier n=1 Tax=Roseibium sp. TaxID=1936156 RepID=UPI003A96D7CA
MQQRTRLTGSALVMAATLLMSASSAQPQSAYEPSWPDLRSELYGDRYIAVTEKVVQLDAPYRTDDDARTDVTVRLNAPQNGRIASVSLILDENPMPVSAQLSFAEPVARFDFTATMRINGPTPVHAVAELENGQLFMAEGFVKTSGQGACAAPPGTDPELALKTLGQMELVLKGQSGTTALISQVTNGAPRDLGLEVAINHPSHSGMQMDQVSLLYIPARYVDTLDLKVNGAPFATLTGSISLSENPTVTVSVPPGTNHVKARMIDTDGTVSEVERSFADY